MTTDQKYSKLDFFENPLNKYFNFLATVYRKNPYDLSYQDCYKALQSLDASYTLVTQTIGIHRDAKQGEHLHMAFTLLVPTKLFRQKDLRRCIKGKLGSGKDGKGVALTMVESSTDNGDHLQYPLKEYVAIPSPQYNEDIRLITGKHIVRRSYANLEALRFQAHTIYKQQKVLSTRNQKVVTKHQELTNVLHEIVEASFNIIDPYGTQEQRAVVETLRYISVNKCKPSMYWKRNIRYTIRYKLIDLGFENESNMTVEEHRLFRKYVNK
jgi:hypothetical protein